MFSEVQLGPEIIFIKYRISLSAGIPNQDLTVLTFKCGSVGTPHWHYPGVSNAISLCRTMYNLNKIRAFKDYDVKCDFISQVVLERKVLHIH
jgi:hypothetical protein